MVETDSLENCYTRNGIGGSNPPASALIKNPSSTKIIVLLGFGYFGITSVFIMRSPRYGHVKLKFVWALGLS